MAREDYPEAWLWQGDVDGNGLIDISDVAEVSRNYKKPASEAPECDLDRDGWISILDVEKVRRNYGLTYETWIEQLGARRPWAAALTVLIFAIPLGVVGVLGR